jgi:tol-pal system protein YbgF
MKRMLVVAVMAGLTLSAPRGAAAADKAHQQLMAEIRMLQEQQQQLLQLIGGLNDTLKTITTKIDDQSGATRKAFADQKVLVDGIAEGVRVLREKADDTNVRLSSMTQELEALRQTIASMTVPTAALPPGTEPPAGETPTGGPPPTQLPVNPPAGAPPMMSPQRMYDNAYSDYTAGQYDLAILGFSAFITAFPKSDKADDAQLNIGNALYGAGKYKDAAAAYQKVISDYPQGDVVPQAYYKLGLTFDSLKEPALARKAFETLIQKYPNAISEVTLAKQRLASPDRKQE